MALFDVAFADGVGGGSVSFVMNCGISNAYHLYMKINLPTPLIDYTNGIRDVMGVGDDVDALLRDLDRQYPGIRFRMIDEQNKIRAHIKIFVNGELERVLSRPLLASDEILIVAALSGG